MNKHISGLVRTELLAVSLLLNAWQASPCTIAVLSGRATSDGRPLLWKNRDVDSQDNLLKFFKGEKYDFIGLAQVNQPDSVWGGLSSSGLAIVNALSGDLEGGSSTDNGRLMKQALAQCATVEDFEALLLETNKTGRRTQANYGVIDACGGCAIFETGNTTYARFDADKDPSGLLVRTNFALTAARPEEGEGFIRYHRGRQLMEAAATNKAIDVRDIFSQAARDLVNESLDPYPLPYEGSQEGHPYGYIHTNYSINRYRTASCLVIQGVTPGQDSRLAVLWCLLGEPVCGVALPVWVHAGTVPAELTGSLTAPLRDAVAAREQECYTDSSSNRYIDTYRLVRTNGQGVLPLVQAMEEVIFEAAGHALQSWSVDFPSSMEMKAFQEKLSAWAYRSYLRWSWF